MTSIHLSSVIFGSRLDGAIPGSSMSSSAVNSSKSSARDMTTSGGSSVAGQMFESAMYGFIRIILEWRFHLGVAGTGGGVGPVRCRVHKIFRAAQESRAQARVA